MLDFLSICVTTEHWVEFLVLFFSYFVSNLNWLLYFNWRVITIQHCDCFCCPLTLVSHRYTCVQHIFNHTPHPSPSYSSGFFQINSFGCSAACICTPEGWLSCMKLYLSMYHIWKYGCRVFYMKYEICISYFTFVNLLLYFWSWYMVYKMLHIRISVHTSSTWVWNCLYLTYNIEKAMASHPSIFFFFSFSFFFLSFIFFFNLLEANYFTIL